MRWTRAVLIFAVAGLMLPGFAYGNSGINRMMGFRGILRTSAGATVSNGTYAFIFRIYDAATGGNCVYAARGTCGAPTAKDITVTSGSFSTVLGESGDNSITLSFNSDSYFLEVNVAGETMTPRPRLVAAPYAFTAGDLEGLTTSSFIRSDTTSTGRGHVVFNSNPVGTGVSSGTIFINPGTTSAGQTILGIATATSTVNLILDAEGDLSIRGNFVPTSNTVSDLGAFGAAWRDIYSSGSYRFGTGSTSSTLGNSGNIYLGGATGGGIFPASVNALDVGSLSLGFRSYFASTSINVSNGAASSTLSSSGLTLTGGIRASSTAFLSSVTSTSITPWSNNAWDLGAYAAAWRNAYVSDTVRASSTLAGNGSSGAPAYSFISDTTKGMYNGLNDNLAFMAGGGFSTGIQINSQRIIPFNNAEYDIGFYDLAFRDVYVSGSVTSSHMYPWRNGSFDLGAFGAAWRSFYASTSFLAASGSASSTLSPSGLTLTGGIRASSTAFLSSVTSTSITPWSNNAWDLGAYGSAWRNVYVSDTLIASSTRLGNGGTNYPTYSFASNAAAGMFLAGTDQLAFQANGPVGYQMRSAADAALFSPFSNNLADLGNFGIAWRDVYSSGSYRFGTGSTSSTLGNSGNIYLGGATGGGIFPASANTLDIGSVSLGFRSLFASTSLNISTGSSSSTLSPSGLTLTGAITPSSNNASDVGSASLSMRNIFASGTLIIGGATTLNGAVTLGDAVSDILIANGAFASNISPNANDTYDLGGYGAAWNDLYSSGTIRFGENVGAAYLAPNFNNVADLGAFGRAMRDIYSSGSYRFGTGSTSSTLGNSGNIYLGGATGGGIFPASANTLDLGSVGLGWRAVYASDSLNVSAALGPAASGRASSTLAPGRLLFTLATSQTVQPLQIYDSTDNKFFWINASGGFGASSTGLVRTLNAETNDLYDLGSYGSAWRDIYVSGTVSSSVFQAYTTTAGFASTLLTLRVTSPTGSIFQSSATSTFLAAPANAPGNAAFVFDTTVDMTGGATAHATSTALLLLRDAGADRLSIIATSSDSVVFRSHAVSSTSALNKVAAFVFETSNYIGSSTHVFGGANVLFSIRNQPSPSDSGIIDPEFAVYAGGTVVADGSFVANGTPGDVAEYVEIEGEAVEAGDVLVTSDARNNAYQKSSDAFSPFVAGVVATTPKFVIGQPNGTNAPLVLTGLADVKVIDENGPIARGDLLVSSSKPGFAMRYDPAQDDGEALVGILGTALEPLEAGEGKIQAMIRSSWVNNRNATIAKLASDMMTVATAAGVELSPYQSDRRPTRLERELKKAARDEWFLDDAGNFRTTGTYASVINTSKGEVPFYAIQSPKVEFIFSGSGRTNRGVAYVVFDDVQAEAIDSATPIKVVVTQTEAGPGVYVTDKSVSGFTVRVINDGYEEVNFDWIVIARRKGYGDEKDVIDIVDVQDVVDVVEALPAEEATSTPADIGAPATSTIEWIPTEATSTPEEPVL